MLVRKSKRRDDVEDRLLLQPFILMEFMKI